MAARRARGARAGKGVPSRLTLAQQPSDTHTHADPTLAPPQFGGRALGVHLSRGRSPDPAPAPDAAAADPAAAAADPAAASPTPDPDAPPPTAEEVEDDASIARLARLLRAHADRRAAVAAALKAVFSLPGGPGPSPLDVAALAAVDVPDPATFLEGFPRTARLVACVCRGPGAHNKTPLAILHEYATRLGLGEGEGGGGGEKGRAARPATRPQPRAPSPRLPQNSPTARRPTPPWAPSPSRSSCRRPGAARRTRRGTGAGAARKTRARWRPRRCSKRCSTRCPNPSF